MSTSQEADEAGRLALDIARESDGAVVDDRQLVALIYTLMRDEIPAGRMISLVRGLEYRGTYVFTNSHLARLAQDLADDLGATAGPSRDEALRELTRRVREGAPADITDDALDYLAGAALDLVRPPGMRTGL